MRLNKTQKQTGFTPLEVRETWRGRKQKKLLTGFTVIELIVVIAIIAVLSVIVFANVQSYVVKSKNAAIKAILSNEISESVKYYEEHENFNDWCNRNDGQTDYGSYKFDQAVRKNGGVTWGCFCDISVYCNDPLNPATKWCNYVSLVGGGFYCIDSAGNKKINSTCRSSGADAGTCS